MSAFVSAVSWYEKTTVDNPSNQLDARTSTSPETDDYLIFILPSFLFPVLRHFSATSRRTRALRFSFFSDFIFGRLDRVDINPSTPWQIIKEGKDRPVRQKYLKIIILFKEIDVEKIQPIFRVFHSKGCYF